MTDKEVFSLQNCSVCIDNQQILTDVSLNINSGEFWVIHGKSGTGKSTLLQILLGFQRISSGVAKYCGLKLSENIAVMRREVAVVFQEPVLLGESINEVLHEQFAYKYNQSIMPEQSEITNMLVDFGLGNLDLSAHIRTVSGGEKQRLALVRALLLKRKILILDEVSSALDQMHRQQMFDLLLRSGLIIIAVSHDQYWIDNAPNKLELTKISKG